MKNTFLITTLLATTALASNAWADTCTAKSGNCGTNCTYTIDTNCHLVVQGPTEEGQSGSIGGWAFGDNSPITSAEIKGNITSIGWYAFNGAKSLTSITIPDSITEIGDAAFRFTDNLTSITIPNSVTKIQSSAFEGAKSLTSITIPDSVTEIRSSAFLGATSLTNITIPDSVTYIGGDAFNNATSLTSLVIPDSVKDIGSTAFRYMPSSGKIYCPAGLNCYKDYKGTIITYTKNAETGIYTIGDNTYASAQDMQSGTTCAVDTGECATKVAQAMAGSRHCATEQACANLLKMVSDENYDCNSIKTCSAYAKDSANNINLASLYGAPAGGNGGSGTGTSGGSSTGSGKRIYTVEEARQAVEAAGTETVNFRIRYK